MTGFAGGSAIVSGDGVTLFEGSTFCLSNRDGDIEPGTTHGLFVMDTRVISGWHLRLDDRPAQPLTALTTAPYQGTFVGRARSLLVRRDRYVGTGMREDITLTNLSAEATQCELALAVRADFADLFEVKGNRIRNRGEHDVRCAEDTLILDYAWRDGRRGCHVTADRPVQVLPGLLVFRAMVPARGGWTVRVLVTASVDGKRLPMQFPLDRPVAAAAPAIRREEWLRRCPRIETADAALSHTVHRSREDLGSLRLFGGSGPERPGQHADAERDRATIAAGAPWYMTLFGRDSLLTAFMALPLDPSLAVGTLQTLAALQGTKVDQSTEEEPGKILHEVRSGIDAGLALGGSHVYYGTADATPLFVMLLGELRRWGVANAEVDALLPHADRALEWIERYGDSDGDGFVEYRRTTDRGLVNQGWKDSSDGVNFADGRLAEPPIALAEVQGYVHAAYLARAELAREQGDAETAGRCIERAIAVRRAFNERFWLPERGWYAVALDRDKRPVDALASNMGHCLWAGIVDDDKAATIADRLLSKEMFSGWGVRTLASTMDAYNPLSYHNGSIWPHDNALIAAGLMRYGLVGNAQRVALGILDAAKTFGGRLPELFGGFDRAEYPVPVPYPTSCSPQAWAAATPIHLLRVLLRLDPDVPQGRIHLAPALPEAFRDLAVHGLPLAGARVDVRVRAGQASMDGLPDGIRLTPPTRAAPQLRRSG